MNYEHMDYSGEEGKTVCVACGVDIKYSESAGIVFVYVGSEEGTRFLPVREALEIIDEIYLTNTRCHLSASQLILLRPDIMVNIFRNKFGDEVIEWSLIVLPVCLKCYDKQIAESPLL
jgi:hypothetical protein